MKKKVYLVSGGSSGIGLQILKGLSERGDIAISLSRSNNKVERAIKQYPELSGKVDFLLGDISNHKDANRIFKHLEKEYGSLDGLVNNAGVLTKGTIETVSVDDWRFTLDVNLTGPYILTKTLLPLLKKADSASIVNISSIAGLKPGTGIAYSVSKAGMDMLTRFLAGDLGPYNIRVNSVNPGLVKTNIHLDNKIFNDKASYERMLEKARQRYPLGRIGEAGDISSMVMFLLSEEASWISGCILPVDGGVMVENDLIPPK